MNSDTKKKKRIQQAIQEEVAKTVEKKKRKEKTPAQDEAELERLEQERDQELENLSSEIQQIVEKLSVQVARIDRNAKSLIQETAEELKLQFQREGKPHLISQISTIISNVVAKQKGIVTERYVQMCLGEQYKDPLQRMRKIHGRSSSSEPDTEDQKEARENPKGASDYKTEEIEAIENPVILKKIAQVKSAHLDEMMVLLKIVARCDRCMPAFKKALSERTNNGKKEKGEGEAK